MKVVVDRTCVFDDAVGRGLEGDGGAGAHGVPGKLGLLPVESRGTGAFIERVDVHRGLDWMGLGVNWWLGWAYEPWMSLHPGRNRTQLKASPSGAHS